MLGLHDVARFAPGDPAALVAATFACPVCLDVDCDVTLHPAPRTSAAACACATCRSAWSVDLDPGQLLRLTLAPPAQDVAQRVDLRHAPAHGFPWSDERP